MKTGAKKIFKVFGMAFLVFLLGICALSLMAETGSIVGFVYDQDGTTPLAGAVIQFKNLSTDKIFESRPTDENGIFKLPGIESGVYVYNVRTDAGNFSSEGFLAVNVGANETAKMLISLKPYDEKETAAVNGMFKELELAGESLVGTILGFDPYSRMAEVKIVKGRIRLNDRIHAKGKTTDFYQDLSTLSKGGAASTKAVAGESAAIKLNQDAQQGDLIYVVKKKELFPIVLAPVIGFASYVAGSSVIQSHIQIKEEFKQASPFKN